MKNSLNNADNNIEYNDQENTEQKLNDQNLHKPLNINESNQSLISSGSEQNNKNTQNNIDMEEEYNLLFSSSVNIQNLIKKTSLDMDNGLVESRDLNINEELLQKSKQNINLQQSDYLKARIWDYKNDDKILEIEQKVNKIFENLNKRQVESLKKSIRNCTFEVIYKNFNPRLYSLSLGTLSSLDYLIESSTYFSNYSCKDLMFKDKDILKVYL